MLVQFSYLFIFETDLLNQMQTDGYEHKCKIASDIYKLKSFQITLINNFATNQGIRN